MREVPFSTMRSRFVRHYGHATYMNPLYPTTDHVIPYQQFWQYWHDIPGNETHERLELYNATVLSALRAQANEEGVRVIDGIAAKWDEHAHPERH